MANKQNIIEFPYGDAIEEEAALWALRLDGGEMTSEMQTELKAWTHRSARHQQALERMSAMWRTADSLDALAQIAPMNQADPKPPLLRALVGGAIAAGLALLIGAVSVWMGAFSLQTQHEEIRTAIGKQQTITLSDGSIMTLNTASHARIDINRKLRSVTLLEGEAHFDVAKDKNRPFRVFAANGLVQAVGTAFVVRIRDEEVDVIVEEGVVQLFRKALQTEPASATRAGGEWRSLAALTVAESATFDDRLERREKMEPSALKRKLLWRDGFLAFSGESLADVVEEMGRYTDMEIIIDGSELAALPIAGSYEAGNLQGMFDSLERAFGIRASRDADGRVVLSQDG